MSISLTFKLLIGSWAPKTLAKCKNFPSPNVYNGASIQLFQKPAFCYLARVHVVYLVLTLFTEKFALHTLAQTTHSNWCYAFIFTKWINETKVENFYCAMHACFSISLYLYVLHTNVARGQNSYALWVGFLSSRTVSASVCKI